jgi:OHCU decarboxylase
MIDPGLDRLNSLSPAKAEAEFLKCCGSRTWARRMVDQRPFASIDELRSQADLHWGSSTPGDLLEAFRSHPKIGERKAAAPTSSAARAWAEQEQAGVESATHDTMQALADGNRAYEEKFGYIFIVCATGKTSAEMLTILRERLPNDSDRELRVAAEEQRKITQLRLEKLVKSLES